MASEVFERLPPEKQQRILEAAAREFAFKGLGGARIRNLSRVCGVSRGSLYDYFVSKEALLETVARAALEQMAAVHERALEEGGDFFTSLERVMVESAEYVSENPHFALLYLQVAGRGEPVLPLSLHWEVEIRAAQQYLRMLREAIERGEIRPDIDAHTWAFVIDSTWSGFATAIASSQLRVRIPAYYELDRAMPLEQVVEEVKGAIGRFVAELRTAIGRGAGA